jgi:tRNA 2-selenouridine synthase
MRQTIDAPEIWNHRSDWVIMDVRTPAEYAIGHIPEAINFPLFNNEERAIVGTAFKQKSPQNALIAGLELVGPKMAGFVSRAIKLVPNKKIVLYCWRGGKRSGSMSWLLRMAGFETVTIVGGYKAYRSHILGQISEIQLNLCVLGGKTGSGKTFILHELIKKRIQVIDLEGLAKHKGSAFGWIGEKEQPTVEHFENLLFEEILKTDPKQTIWVENESRNIGSTFIPEGFWRQMKQAPLIHLEMSFERRLNHLVESYTTTRIEDLLESFDKIGKKIGGLKHNEAKNALLMGDYHAAGAIALAYYDKMYIHGFETNVAPIKKVIEVGEEESFEEIAGRISG